MLAFLGSFLDQGPKLAHASGNALEGETEPHRSRLRLPSELRVLGLR